MRKRTFAVLGVLVIGVLLGATLGCTRARYRVRADEDANRLVDQKSVQAGTRPGAFRIDIQPASRMFDGDDPDLPPMPPDDPVAHQLLCCIDGKRGADSNCNAERTPYVENPHWRDCLPTNERGAVELDLEGAVRLALLHSTDYQQELEELYLSALDVSFEQFLFDGQLFSGSALDFTADGRDRPGSGGESSSLLNVSPFDPANQLRIEKLTATGGTLVAGIANSLVWQFAGPDDFSGTTLIDFLFTQPLLQNAGRAVILETLTIAERSLLANVRAMERFRRGFFLEIGAGIDAGPGPSRRGGFFGGSGLTGFTGVGGGGFGRVGGFGGGGGGGGFGGAGGAGAGQVGGYLGLLQNTQGLRNLRANVVALRASTDQLEESYAAGRIDRFQVDLARQALYNAQSRLLGAETDSANVLDNFKVTLGLPPDVEIELTDERLERFDLRSPDLTTLQSDVSDAAGAARRMASTYKLSDQPAKPSGQPTPRPDDPTNNEPTSNEPTNDAARQPLPAGGGPVLLPAPSEITGEKGNTGEENDRAANQNSTDLDSYESIATPNADDFPALLADCRQLAERAREQLAGVEADYRRLQAVLPRRRQHLRVVAERESEQAVSAGANFFLSTERLDERANQLGRDIGRLATLVEERLATIDRADLAASEPERLKRSMTGLSAALLELSLQQARARLDAFDIEPTDLAPEEALAIASRHRRDWMNARVALVDAWRLVNFNANDLLSGLDVNFSGDISNLGDNPFRLRGTTGRLQVGLEFDAPLTRLGERNVYRQSLIEYQQARRNYYQFVDRLSQSFRALLRQIRLNEVNLELRREAVLVAISQVDLTQIRLTEPPKPGEENLFGSTTARDLVQALSDLLTVQNEFLSVWINNEVQLLRLEFDLGLMRLAPDGTRVPLEAPLRSYLGTSPPGIDGAPLATGPDVLSLQATPLGCLPTDPLLSDDVLEFPVSLVPHVEPPAEPTNSN